MAFVKMHSSGNLMASSELEGPEVACVGERGGGACENGPPLPMAAIPVLGFDQSPGP